MVLVYFVSLHHICHQVCRMVRYLSLSMIVGLGLLVELYVGVHFRIAELGIIGMDVQTICSLDKLNRFEFTTLVECNTVNTLDHKDFIDMTSCKESFTRPTTFRSCSSDQCSLHLLRSPSGGPFLLSGVTDRSL